MSRRRGHAVVLGGLGGDAHSVGLTVLRRALVSEGYRVAYLGPQARLGEYFCLEPVVNAVLISSHDGHAGFYLRGFPELRRRHPRGMAKWYLGGNLVLGDGLGEESRFLDMGFDRVFVKFVDLSAVLAMLAADLHGTPPAAGLLDGPASVAIRGSDGGRVSGGRLAAADLLAERREVLDTWHTGRRAADLEDNAEALAAAPSWCRIQAEALARRRPLIQPRCGVPLVRDQMRLFAAFKAVGIEAVSYQVDSLTRCNDYHGAEQGLRDSRRYRAAALNGFPVIQHGPVALRRIVRSVGLPVQTRHSTRDPRLLAEISYAGGVTSFEGGAICYNLPYYRDYPLAESLRRWRYVDRLTGLYRERYGVTLDREFFGVLTATLIPPSLAITVCLLEALLAAEQGVGAVSLGYAEQGHRIQDVAAIRTLGAMGREILARLGHARVQVATVFHQYMAAFPPDAERARELIVESAVTAGLSGATRVLIKTPVESRRIPVLADNLEAIDLVRGGLAAAAEAAPEPPVDEECAQIRREVEALLDTVLVAGGGDLGLGIVRSFERGRLDLPFAPSLYVRGRVATARDADGAVRFLDVGDLPFDRDTVRFHAERMSERRRMDRLGPPRRDYLRIERDVLRVPRGDYERWPLGGAGGRLPVARALAG